MWKKWISTHFLDPLVTYMIYKACTHGFHFLLSMYKEIRHHERIRLESLIRNTVILRNYTFFINISVMGHASRIDHSKLIVDDVRSRPLKTTCEDDLSREGWGGGIYRRLMRLFPTLNHCMVLWNTHKDAPSCMYMASWFMNIITCHFGFLRGESLFVFKSLFTI